MNIRTGITGLTIATAIGLSAAANAENVFVTSVGDGALDALIEMRLEDAGHTVDVGAAYGGVDGTQDFSGYDVVILTITANGGSLTDMPAAGQTALLDFVDAGGGLIVNAGVLAQRFALGHFATLEPAFPVTTDGATTNNATATWTAAAADAALNAGLPTNFTFDVDSFLGVSEGNIIPKASATAYYDSAAHDAGVVGMPYGLGRAIAFSVAGGSNALMDANFAQFLDNAVEWTGAYCDGGTGNFIAACEAETNDAPGAAGDGMFIEVFNGIGGGAAPNPATYDGVTPTGATLSPFIDFPNPGTTINVGQNFATFFASTTTPPDALTAVPASNFTLRITGFIKITSDMDLEPGTDVIDMNIGVGSDDGFWLEVGDTFLGSTGDRGFTYSWFPIDVEDEGLYPITLYFTANAVGFSGLEFAWNTALNGQEVIPQPYLYLGDTVCTQQVTFEELPTGTVLTDQYAAEGLIVDSLGGMVEITDAFPTEWVPVTPPNVLAAPNEDASAAVDFTFVVPGTTTSAVTDYFSFFVIDTETLGSTITAYDADGEVVYSETVNGGGASQVFVEIAAPFIERVNVTLGDATDRSAIDSICFTAPYEVAAPDLVATDIANPAGTVFTGDDAAFSFTVANMGDEDAVGSVANVYLSDDDMLGGDTLLGAYPVSAIAAGGNDVVNANATFAAPAGTYWLIVEADANDDVTETGAEDNNVLVAATSLVISDYPDLEVTDITVSQCPTPTPGRMFEVSWTVTNNGDADATGMWTDEIVLVDDSPFPRGGATIVLATFDNAGPLAPAGTYTRTEMMLIPEGFDGDLNHVRVTTDVEDSVIEGPGETNNTTDDDQNVDLSDSGNVTLFCWNQLGAASAGNWNVASDGQSVLQTINGQPTYFVSDFDLIGSQFTGTFSVETGSDDDFIGFVFGVQNIENNGGGEYYLLDWKQGNQSNGERGLKLKKIIGSNPDLWNGENQAGVQEILARYDTAVDLGAPGWADFAEYTFFLTYQVVTPERGAGAEGRIRVIIRDASDNEIWNTGLIVDPAPLGPGPVGFYNYSQSNVRYAGFTQAELQPPVSDPGGPYAFDASMADVLLDGSGSTDPDGLVASYQWDLGADGVGDDAGRINVTEPITFAEAIGKGLALGADVPVLLTVEDEDALSDTAQTSITYMNAAPTADPGGPYAAVGPGQSVQLMGAVNDVDLGAGVGETINFEWDTAPAVTAADIGDGFTVLDPVIDFETLIGLSQPTLYLNVVDASGLVTSVSVDIPLVFPNLTVTDVNAPMTAPEGMDITVSWTVENTGAFDATATFTDAVFLSADATLDGGDIMIGSAQTAGLAMGAAATPSVVTDVPDGLRGVYYVIVRTDANDDVEEVTAEGDNTLAAVTATTFFADCNGNGQPDLDDISGGFSEDCNGNMIPDECELDGSNDCNGNGVLDECDIADGTSQDVNGNGIPDECEPQLDLRVTSVTAPTEALAGQTVAIAWDVVNEGSDDVTGSWNDRVYLSADQMLDPADAQVATETVSGPLGAGGAYTRSANVTLPVGAATWYVLVRTDDDNVIDELANEDDNGLFAPAPLVTVNAPDLVVTDIVAPTGASVGGEVTISWTVMNNGGSDATGPWSDQLRLSGDDAVGGDTPFATITYNGTLAPGESDTITETVSLPAGEDGMRWIVVMTDSGDDVFEVPNEGNNATVDDAPIDVSAPDLIVTDITAPSNAAVNGQVQISWNVMNDGLTPISGVWADRILQSTDDLVGGDVELDTFFYSGDLMPGESYTQSKVVRLAPGLAGDQYLIVRTDANANIDEGAGESNNDAVDDAVITVNAPDLAVTALSGPASAAVGDSVQISWTITNEGAAPATGTWTDRVLLSGDDAIGGDDQSLGDFAFTGSLDPGESYTRNEIVTLAPGAGGDRYLVLRTNFTGTLDEGGANGNNALIDDASIAVSAPDLIVTVVTTPTSAPIGGDVSVTWTVRNDGDAPASGVWSDRVRQSNDDAIGGDSDLASFAFAGTLDPGETYTKTETVTLSTGASGPQRIVVVADAAGDIDEGVNEGNNATISTVDISVSSPDLVVTDITAPSTAMVRDLIEISWTVTNNGSETADGSWSDQVALSDDSSVGGDTVIGSFGHTGSLAPGESYTQTRSIVLPATAVNERRIVIRTDINNELAEGAGDGNNASIDDMPVTILGPDLVVDAVTAPSSATHGDEISVEWTGRNAGDATAVGNWADGVYLSQDDVFDSGDRLIGGDPIAVSPLDVGSTYDKTSMVTIPLDGDSVDGTHYLLVRANAGGELVENDTANNVAASMPIELTRPDLPNLQVTGIVLPPDAAPGADVEVRWTITNTGDAPISGESWGETLFVSADGAIGNDTTTLAIAASDDLDPGESVERIETIPAPNLPGNTYHIRILVDNTDTVLEINEADNNLISTSPARILRPDLIAVGVVAPNSGVADGMINVAWTVRNDGEAPVNGVFIDRVFLSRDMILDENADTRVLTQTGPQTLGVGESYMRDVMVTVPGRIEGPWFVIVKTNANGSVRESGLPNLNIASSSTPVIISQPTRPNLIVSDIQTPTGGLGGSTFDFTYEVTNAGAADAVGFWSDRIYVSDDPFLDETDPVLGTIVRSDPVLAGESYEVTATLKYPSAPGDYRIIVRADQSDALNEGLDGGENDNDLIDASTFVVDTYIASVDADITSAVAGTPVNLTGTATIEGLPGVPAANVPVDVRLRVQGSRRVLRTTTDANGDFGVTFQPLLNEGGLYAVAAAPPHVTQDIPQDQFSLYSLLLSNSFASPVLLPGEPVSGQIVLRNPGDLSITGLSASIQNLPSSVDLDVQFADPFVPANGVTTLQWTMEATEEISLQQIVNLTISSDQGNMRPFQFFTTVVPNFPNIQVNPTSLASEMVRGEQTILELQVTNVGGAPADDLELLLPPLSWLQPGVSASLPVIDPGETATVVLHLLPEDDLTLGEYTGQIAISGGDGSYGASVPFSFIATSNLTGDLLVRPEDEFTYWSTGEYEEEGGPIVDGAFIRLTDPYSGDIVAEGITDVEGGDTQGFFFTDIPEGVYDIEVAAVQHGDFRGTVLVESNAANFIAPFLPRESVSYSWIVEEIEIDDTYIFTLEATFVTNVPTPVVTIEPPVIDLEAIEGDVAQIDFTVSNHGLISTNSSNLNFGEHPAWRITPLVEDLGPLPAESETVVPVLFERVAPRDSVERNGGPCNIDAGLTWTLICAGENQYFVPVVVFNASGKCTSGPGGPSGGCWGCGGGFSGPGGGGGPSGPYVNTPSYEPPEECECEDKDLGTADISPYLSPIESAAESLLNSIPRLEDVEVSIEGEVSLKLECCDEDSAELVIEGSAGGEASAKITLVGASFSDSGSTELEGVTDLNGNPVSVSWEFSAEAGCFVYFDGSLSGSVEIGGCDDRFDVMGSGSAGANLCCSAGVMGSATLSAPVEGVDDLTASFDASIGICTGGEMGFTYDDDSGLDGYACFRGVWIEGGLNFNFPGIGAVNIIPSGSRYYLVDPTGPCADDGRVLEYTVHYDSFNIGEKIKRDVINDARGRVFADYRMIPIEPETESDRPEPSRAEGARADDGVCATVRLQLEQEVVISRTAFQATLEITNNNSISSVEDIFVSVLVEDEAGNDVTDLFAFQEPELTNLNAIDGTGVIGPEDFGRARFVLIPTRDAAPMETTRYFVTGVLSYTDGGVGAVIDLAPAPINVAPDPLLVVKYFWQRDVFADDPFTEPIEPSEPFTLGLSMSNIGYGDARNVRVTSSQPRIIENERGLLIAFEIIGAQVGTEEISPSLSVNLGDINPDETAVARWLMTSTLQGQFTEYEASFEHVDGLGDPRISLIDSVEIYELIHAVLADEPEGSDDGLPDFMTNEIPDPLDLDIPDTVHLSDGTVEDVTAIFGASVNGPLPGDDIAYEVTNFIPDQWFYWRFDDPTNGQYNLTRVERSDGKEIILEWNAWQTDRTFRDPQEQPIREHKVHLFDRAPAGQGGTYTYTLIFSPDADAPNITAWESLAEHGPSLGNVPRDVTADGAYVEPRADGVSNLRVEFTEAVDASTFTPAAVAIDGLTAPDNIPVDPAGAGVTVSTMLVEGDTVGLITFNPPLPDLTRYRLELVGVTDLAGNALPGGGEIFFTALVGDVTGDRRVNNTDVGAVASLLGTDPINPANRNQVRSDINSDGVIDQLDLDIVLARRGGDARFVPDPVAGGGLALGDGQAPANDYYNGEPSPDRPDTLNGADGLAGLSGGGETPRLPVGADAVGDGRAKGDDGDSEAANGPATAGRPMRADAVAVMPGDDVSDERLAAALASVGVATTGVNAGPDATWRIVRIGQRHADVAAFETMIDQVAALEEVRFASPVFRPERGDGYLVTSNMLVSFDPLMSDKLKRMTLLRAGAGAAIEIDHRGIQGLWLINIAGDSAIDALRRAERLRDLPGVLFAEPVILDAQPAAAPAPPADALEAAGR